MVLSIDISATGEVTRAEVVEPAGHGFDEAALAAVRQFRFTPAEVDGKPSPVRITYAYDFVLRPAPTAGAGVAGGSGQLQRPGARARKPETARRGGGRAARARMSDRSPTRRDGSRFATFRRATCRWSSPPPSSRSFETTERVDAGKETQATYHVLRTFFSPYETVVRGAREKKEVTPDHPLARGGAADPRHHRRRAQGRAEPARRGPSALQRRTDRHPRHEPAGLGHLPRRRAHPAALPLRRADRGLQQRAARVGGLPSRATSPRTTAASWAGWWTSRAATPRPTGSTESLEVNAYNANVVLEAPITDTLSIAAAYRRSYIDLILPLFLKSDSPTFTVAPRYDDAQLKLVWKPNAQEHALQLLGAAQPGRRCSWSRRARRPAIPPSAATSRTRPGSTRSGSGTPARRTPAAGHHRRLRPDGRDPQHRRAARADARGEHLGHPEHRRVPRLGVDRPRRRRGLDLHPGHVPAPRSGSLHARASRPSSARAAEVLYANSPFWQSQLGLWGELRLQAGAAAPDHPRRADGPGHHPSPADAHRDRRPATGDALDGATAVDAQARRRPVPRAALPPGRRGGRHLRQPGPGEPLRASRRSLGAEWNIRPDLLLDVEVFYNRLWDIPVSTSAHHRAERPAGSPEPGQRGSRTDLGLRAAAPPGAHPAALRMDRVHRSRRASGSTAWATTGVTSTSTRPTC